MKTKSSLSVIALASDPVASSVLRKLATEAGSVKRRRSFEQNGKVDSWKGSISYGPNHEFSVEVEISILDRKLPIDADWMVSSQRGFSRFFSTSALRVSEVSAQIRSFPGRLMVVCNGRPSRRRKERDIDTVCRNAADHLAAELTSQGTFKPEFLAFPGGRDQSHYQMVKGWIENGQPIKLVSGCCLNADESRRGIVPECAPEIIDLLAKTSGAAFAGLPIQEWYIYTFGPSDLDFLGDLGITKVLLPYMWDAPRDKVLADLEQNFALTKEVGNRIAEKVDFPVIVGQLSDHAHEVDIKWLVEQSHARAKVMLPKLMETPPAIFAQLSSEQEVFDRVQQEAFLYLLDTCNYGQVPKVERPPVLYVGLEVHGGYWAHGNLFEGPNGEFLPLSWLPQCVRQHWGKWTLSNSQNQRERQRLDYLLRGCGF